MIINKYKSSSIREILASGSIYGIGKAFYKRIIPLELRQKFMYQKNKKRLNQIINSEHTSLFTALEIETINRCNGICPFCPVNKSSDKRPLCIMDEELFVSIIAQLKELNYSGKICLFSNNEPFLDDRIVKFMEIAKRELPQAFHYIYTNGTVLTLDKFIESMRYLDKMVIDNYNDKLVLNKTAKEIYEYCVSNSFALDRLEIHLRKLTEVLQTRGGNSPNNKKKKTLAASCILPFTQFVIRPDGKVSLCCNDALGEITLGDLNNQRIIDVWNSKEYGNVRMLIRKGRKNIKICEYCDTLKIYNY